MPLPPRIAKAILPNRKGIIGKAQTFRRRVKRTGVNATRAGLGVILKEAKEGSPKANQFLRNAQTKAEEAGRTLTRPTGEKEQHLNTYRKLRSLANHPGTPKPEAEGAKRAADKLKNRYSFKDDDLKYDGENFNQRIRAREKRTLNQELLKGGNRRIKQVGAEMGAEVGVVGGALYLAAKHDKEVAKRRNMLKKQRVIRRKKK